MKKIIASLKSNKEPANKMSVLFFIFLICGIYIGCTGFKALEENKGAAVELAGNGMLNIFILTLALHLLVFLAFVKGCQTSIFISKAYIISSVVGSLCGINIGKLYSACGFIGFSAGIVSYLPHYVLLFVMYGKILKKINSDYILTRTDYVKYVIILIVITAVHVFISDNLAGMLVNNL